MLIDKRHFALLACAAIAGLSFVIDTERFGLLDRLIDSGHDIDVVYALAALQAAITLWLVSVAPRHWALSLVAMALLLVGQAAAIEGGITFALMALAASRGGFAP